MRSSIYGYGPKIKNLRMEKKMSQQDVADRIGVSRFTISSYEREIVTPSLEMMVQLALLFNVSIDYLAGIEKRTCIYLGDFSQSEKDTLLKFAGRIEQISAKNE